MSEKKCYDALISGYEIMCDGLKTRFRSIDFGVRGINVPCSICKQDNEYYIVVPNTEKKHKVELIGYYNNPKPDVSKIEMINSPKNYGWVCPVCGRGNSPYTTTCPCQPIKLDITC